MLNTMPVLLLIHPTDDASRRSGLVTASAAKLQESLREVTVLVRVSLREVTVLARVLTTSCEEHYWSGLKTKLWVA